MFKILIGIFQSQEDIETNNYLDSQNQQYPIYNKDKDIINNIKIKIIIINGTRVKREIIHIEVTEIMMTSIE